MPSPDSIRKNEGPRAKRLEQYYFWEFLRRNKNYQKDFGDFKIKFGNYLAKSGQSPVRWRHDLYVIIEGVWISLNNYPKSISKANLEAIRFDKKWGILPTDPKIYVPKDRLLAAKNPEKLLPIRGLSLPPAVSDIPTTPIKAVHGIPKKYLLTLRVDLRANKDSILKSIKNILAEDQKGILAFNKKTQYRARFDKFDGLLKIFDLRSKNYSYQKIAKLVYPEEWSKLHVSSAKGSTPRLQAIERVKKEAKRAANLIGKGIFKQYFNADQWHGHEYYAFYRREDKPPR